MLAKRIIACLDVKDGQTVKGVSFENLRYAGDPVELGKAYSEQGVDELVYLDITATNEGRKQIYSLVESVAKNLSIPFTIGGGITSVEDAENLLIHGADKISVNSAAVRNPQLVSDLALKFGKQFVVVAIDVRHGTVTDLLLEIALVGHVLGPQVAFNLVGFGAGVGIVDRLFFAAARRVTAASRKKHYRKNATRKNYFVQNRHVIHKSPNFLTTI